MAGIKFHGDVIFCSVRDVVVVVVVAATMRRALATTVFSTSHGRVWKT
jgi:hypothetical protein